MSNNFVDFEVYKKSVQLTKGIYMLLSNPVFIRESAFSNQLKRAVLSITNNIAEGSEYNSNNQFIRYLKIAKGSCAEVRNMLMLANELNFANIDELKGMINLSTEISQQLPNFINYLDRNRSKD